MIRRSLILDTTVRLIFDAAMVLSVYLLFAGHNQPGGGFVGGLVAASAVALRYIAGGPNDVFLMFRVQPWTLLSAGLTIAASTALLPLLFGEAPLDQQAAEWHAPMLGTINFATATVFDTGVYLIVVGLVLMIFEALGEDPDTEPSPPNKERP